ncbi:S41 family peptidase [Aerococcaceae bacterium zg-ZUI334]|uniref:S41 family peptidase n=1 Tax=Aerococcaceae bacterium zg-252 TaxID=2796928 RepID=UPI001B942D56|nr:S41 family peptidase [Aerococcaceae bacterium zg-ZUI334]
MNHNFFTHKKHFQQLSIVLSLFFTIITVNVLAEEQNYVSPNEFFAEFIEVLNTEAIYKNTPEWKEFYSNHKNSDTNYTSYSSLYLDLYDAVRIAGGAHSQLRRVTPSSQNNSYTDTAFYEYPTVEQLDNGIIHITIPSTWSFTTDELSGKKIYQSKEYNQYINTVLDYMVSNTNSIKGIIIDLRNNNGGFLHTMIQATNFLFDESKLLALVNSDEKENGYFELKNATLLSSREKERNYPINRIEKINVPVAVLTNGGTFSAGEIMSILIKESYGNKSKSFGKMTGGYTSPLETYKLPNNYFLSLATGYFKINGVIYKDKQPLKPDVETETPLEDAIEWLNEMISND